MASDKVKDHSDSKRGNLLPHKLLFPISSKGSERITHIKAFDMAGTRNRLVTYTPVNNYMHVKDLTVLK